MLTDRCAAHGTVYEKIRAASAALLINYASLRSLVQTDARDMGPRARLMGSEVKK